MILPVVGVDDHHRRRVAAADEEDLVLASNARPAGTSAFRRDVVMRGHLHRLGIDDGDVVLVFDVDVDVAVAIGDRLLRRAAQIERADDRCRPWRR